MRTSTIIVIAPSSILTDGHTYPGGQLREPSDVESAAVQRKRRADGHATPVSSLIAILIVRTLIHAKISIISAELRRSNRASNHASRSSCSLISIEPCGEIIGRSGVIVLIANRNASPRQIISKANIEWTCRQAPSRDIFPEVKIWSDRAKECNYTAIGDDIGISGDRSVEISRTA